MFDIDSILDTLRSEYVGHTVIHDDEIVYVKSAQEWEHGGMISLDVDDGHGPKQVVLDAAEAKSLKRAKHCINHGELVDSFLDCTWDVAPKGFMDDFRSTMNDVLDDHDGADRFVWAYGQGKTLGRPQPVTREAYKALALYDKRKGSSHEENAVFPPKTYKEDYGCYIAE